MTFRDVKNWIRKYPFAAGLLAMCLAGFLGLIGKLGYLFIGVGYAILHLDGFWDTIKSIFKK